MKFLRIAVAIVLLLAAAAGAAWLARDKIVAIILESHLASELSLVLGTRVKIEDAGYADGKLRVGRGVVEGRGAPFSRLEFGDARTTIDWRRLRQLTATPLNIEVAVIDLAWQGGGGKPTGLPHRGGPGRAMPPLDILASRLSCRHEGSPQWCVRETAARLRHEGGKWALSARGGALELPGWPAMHIDRLSLEQQDRGWRIPSFALHHGEDGALAGSLVFEDGGASGEFSWQDVPLDGVLPDGAERYFTARSSGDARLERGELRGSMKLSGAETRRLPALVKLASVFTGEDYSVVPWQSLRFDFVRAVDGSVTLENLLAVSPKGLAVRGSGRLAEQKLSADLQLGVRREGKPWLVAFMPLLFRNEKEGYLWTSVKVGGTVEAPTEDLTPRIVAALAAAPAAEAVDAAAEVPAAAAEAAGDLLRKLIGR